jgi:hypothetical protein
LKIIARSLASGLMCVASACCLLPTALSGEPQSAPPQRVPAQRRYCLEPAVKGKTYSYKQEGEETKKCIAEFISLPPEERVRIWRNAGTWKNRNTIASRSQQGMEDALIALGLDAVPYLAKVVRAKRENLYYRYRAMVILCKMDRFVPQDQFPMPMEPFVYVPPPNQGGQLNPFMIVDGRRIGKDGYEVIRWAAEQTEDKEVRFHARELSGLLEQDLRQLPLDEQIRRWEEAVVKSKGLVGAKYNPDQYTLYQLMGDILVEKMPESLPPLIHMLETNSNGYVQEGIIGILWTADAHKMRLRATEMGRQAIEVMRKALERGNLKPVYAKREERERLWKEMSATVLNDEVTVDPMSQWTLYARAFAAFFGDRTALKARPGFKYGEAVPEMRQFVTYLTEVDPYFPSWEYFSFGGGAPEEVLHPRFKVKMARYYEPWKRFQAKQRSSSQMREQGMNPIARLLWSPTANFDTPSPPASSPSSARCR